MKSRRNRNKTIGDWSNSNSERYDLKVGPITHQAAKFGVVETKNYNLFRAGNRYEVRIIHRGTDPSKWWYPNADYDYIAQIEAVSLPAGVTMQIEDPDGILGTHGDSNTPNGVFDAAGKVAYINLIKMINIEVTGINFDHSSGDTADGISIDDTSIPEWLKDVQNDPAAYKKNTSVTIKARFTVSPDTITSAKIRAVTSDSILGNLGEQMVTFSDGESSPEYITFTPSNSTPDSISKDTVLWQWKARDLNGEGAPEYNINISGPHTIYTVYDSPKCSVSNVTINNLDGAVGKALGEGAEAGVASKANDNVGDNVYEGCICGDGFQKNFDAAMGNYPTSGNKGMCCCRAEGLDCVLNVLGIGPYAHDYVNELPEPNPDRAIPPDQYCAICNKWCFRGYWDGFWNNWEGVVKAGGNGTTCYAPANGSISIDEGTYTEIKNAITTDCGFYWAYGANFTDTCPHLAAP